MSMWADVSGGKACFTDSLPYGEMHALYAFSKKQFPGLLNVWILFTPKRAGSDSCHLMDVHKKGNKET